MPPKRHRHGGAAAKAKAKAKAAAKASARARAKAKARAKARARFSRANARRQHRREALAQLNELAGECGLLSAQVVVKLAMPAEVERLVRLLEARCGGDKQQRLRAAAKAWEDNGGEFSSPVVAEDDDTPAPVASHRVLKPNFELKSRAFMLTYHSASFKLETWAHFRAFVMGLKAKLGARAWSACLEESLSAPSASPVFHLHAYLFWTDGVGVHCRELAPLYFGQVRPRVDVCKGRLPTTAPSSGALHGLWYVAVRKNGTMMSDTNYPAGVWYKPQPQWLQNLYQDKKLSYEQYILHSATHFPVGHSARKRDADEALRDQKEAAVRELVQRELEELRRRGLYQEPRTFTDLDDFVGLFDRSAWRRPLLLILGATNLGKSLLAGHVLERVAKVLGLSPPAYLEVTVEGDGHLDCSGLDVAKHGGLLLDGVGDVLLLKKNRESLQGRPKVQWGGRSQTMRYAYPFTLARRAVVATMDLSADNLHLLESDHWLSDPKNVKVFKLTTEAWEQPGSRAPRASQDRGGDMQQWRAGEVASFLKSKDLEGPAAVLFQNGVAGGDLFAMTSATLVKDLRLSAFAAAKVLAARRVFLQG